MPEGVPLPYEYDEGTPASWVEPPLRLSLLYHDWVLRHFLLKGTVSRELRPMLLYIIQKLFSRSIVASLKIFILLKGQFAMYIKPFSVS